MEAIAQVAVEAAVAIALVAAQAAVHASADRATVALVPAAPAAESRERYIPRRKVCSFCVDKVENIDYKDVNRLKRYLSERAKNQPRRKTGTCARHQRALSVALKRARHMALLPFIGPHSR